jgi:hypothetical protein
MLFLLAVAYLVEDDIETERLRLFGGEDGGV